MFAGAHTALVTPFRDREFDEHTFRNLIDRQFDRWHRRGCSGWNHR